MQRRTIATARAAKRETWRHHVTEQRNGDLSQRAYCERCGLTLASFTRWRRILSEEPLVEEAALVEESAFVPVAFEQSASISSCTSVTLPNGVRIDGVNTSNISIVVALMQTL